MKRHLFVLLIAVLAAGCASASATFTPINQEKWVQKTLTGTWNGYIKDTPYARVGYNTPKLQIFGVERTVNGGWFIDLYLNGRKIIDAAELTVYKNNVIIEFIEHYSNIVIFYRLVLDNSNHRLVGHIWFKTRSFRPHEITFDKVVA